jgi:hypothetical protein
MSADIDLEGRTMRLKRLAAETVGDWPEGEATVAPSNASIDSLSWISRNI